MSDPVTMLVFGLPMLVVALLVLRVIVRGGAFASNSKKSKLNSQIRLLDSRIEKTKQEIRDLNRQIAEYKNHG